MVYTDFPHNGRLVSGAGRPEHITSVLTACTGYQLNSTFSSKYSVWLTRPYTALLHRICVRASLPTNWQVPSLSWPGFIVHPKVRLKKIAARAFPSVAPSLYNTIPLDIHQAPSLDSFKSNLKTHLFCIAYNLSWVTTGLLLLYCAIMYRNSVLWSSFFQVPTL